MPKWGLTRRQIEAEPWGIPADLLMPAKTVTDPVHGDVYLNRLETDLLNSPPLQRLRGVRQLGTSHLVYPGATHSRFSHALGALRAAQDLLDAVIDNRSGPRPSADLFDEWDPTADPRTGLSQFDHNLAEVTVLTRLGGLLHDMCHVAFGHTIEDDLKVLRPHDENLPRFRQLWARLPRETRELLAKLPELRKELLPLIMSVDPDSGKKFDVTELRYPFVADIVGNTICADLIDYLRRDHANAGLPIALGYRFANDFYVSPSKRVFRSRRMVIRITRDGQRRVDIVTELLKYLRFRYELSERVLVHHAKLAADVMIGKLLEMWSDWVFVERARQHKPEIVKAHGAAALTALKDELAKYPTPDLDPYVDAPRPAQLDEPANLVEAIQDEVREELEEQFTRRSDDGLLEYLHDWGSRGEATDARRKAVGELAGAVLERRLFKPIGRAASAPDRANAEHVYSRFGSADQRRKLEKDAAECAELDPGWQVLVWVPSPDMRLKVAEVLVDDGRQITPLDKAGYPGVQEIYDNHQNLWGVSAYLHPEVKVGPNGAASDIVLAVLSDAMGLDFEPRAGGQSDRRRTDNSRVLDLAVAQLADESELVHAADVDRLRAVAAHSATDRDDLRPGQGRTFSEIKRRLQQLGEAEGVLPTTSH